MNYFYSRFAFNNLREAVKKGAEISAFLIGADEIISQKDIAWNNK
ncbi:MAG: hypothetical protein JWQ40_83 [Segetibacter sp.]|nr:hypothetical protein [Segetibacter sp.]